MNPARARVAVALAILVFLGAPLGARAFPDDPGPRAIGMGGAGVADARADEGPRLNPSGMSLARVYTVEADYRFITKDGGHLVHAAVVDSTSDFKLGAGLFYTYRTAALAGASRLGGHEAGLALSYSFGEYVLLGATGKYLRLSGGPLEADGTSRDGGFTADAGLTIRAASILTIGVAGYNLRDLSTAQAPLALGYGIGLTPAADLTIVVDGLEDFTTSDPTRGVRTTVTGGAEYVINRRAVPRLGGGRDGGSGHGYVTAGLTALSELGAVDFGFRQDVSGDSKLTFIVVGLRLFVPSP
jgi:hypothetical protein